METLISLSQIGLYNPQRQSAEVSERLFVIRQKQFALLLEGILQEKGNSIPQHYLIVGQRGMGKTTMLKRMEVELHKEQYRSRFIPLLFPEEQYNVKDLAEFWLNCLDALADSLELENPKDKTIELIDNQVKELSEKASKVISEKAYNFLMETCKKLHRRSVLLVDNIGLVFSRLNKHEQHILRALLSENAAPIIVGAGVALTNDVLSYDMPFYDFFQIQYLKKLSFDDFLDLLKNLAKQVQSDSDLASTIEREKPRLRALYHFTGGNPRTAVMLFKLLVKGFSADINDDLDALVDEVTPLYKAKFEELSQQQQIIIDVIAMNWDAIPLNKIATTTNLKNNQLSPQLKRLIEDGWVETTAAYKAKGNAYFISERFFNIWYLIRRSNRRQKKEIYCLSKFLESFYGEEVHSIALQLSRKRRIFDKNQISYGLALSELKQVRLKTRRKLKEKAIDALFEFAKENAEILKQYDISEDYIKKISKMPSIDSKILDNLVLLLSANPNDINLLFFIGKLYEDMYLEGDDIFLHKAKEIYEIILEIDKNNVKAWCELSGVYYQMHKTEKAVELCKKAIELQKNDVESYKLLGDIYQESDQYDKAEHVYKEMIAVSKKKGDVSYAWHNLGRTLLGIDKFEEAEEAYKQALKLKEFESKKFSFVPMRELGDLYIETKQYEQAELLFKQIIHDKNSSNFEKSVLGWSGLGNLYVKKKEYCKAEEAYKESIKLYDYWYSKYSLCTLYRDDLGKMQEAKTLFYAIEERLNEESKERVLINKTLFELYDKNEGKAKEYIIDLLNTIDSDKEEYLQEELNYFAVIVLKLHYSSWLLQILEETGYDIKLSAYYTAIKYLEIEQKENTEKAEIYLKNRAVEISEPAKLIIEKIRKYMD
ncbi:MAG: tetratricopeptide repeat protein [Bacteroidetes bacterium]|nr:tetratricopeptide repeat protein [Bacteroidota bacterium]